MWIYKNKISRPSKLSLFPQMKGQEAWGNFKQLIIIHQRLPPKRPFGALEEGGGEGNQTLHLTFKFIFKKIFWRGVFFFQVRFLLGGWWHPPPKSVVNLPRTYEKLPWKCSAISETDRQKSCYFFKRIFFFPSDNFKSVQCLQIIKLVFFPSICLNRVLLE